MYGSHYTGNYQNPPQPEWQQQHPPPPPPGNAYNPNTYGPIQPSTSPAPGIDTTSWGVRYNHNAPPPPLPPRTGMSPPPPSAPTSSYSSPLATTAPPLPTRPGATETNTWDYSAGYNQPSQSPVPPPRPPLPPAYQNEVQQNAPAWQPPQQPYAPQYSHHAPTHHYDPSTPPPAPPPQSHTPTYSAGNQAPINYHQPPPMNQYQVAPPASSPAPPAMSPPPVPPTMSPPPGPPPGPPMHTDPQTSQGPSNASALGFGSPSDWEYLSPTPGDVNDDHLYQQNTSPAQSHAQPAPPSQVYQPAQSQSPVSHVSISAFSAPVQSTPVNNAAPDHQPVPHSTRPARDDSVRSEYSTVSSMGYSETIDGVIQAWNQPVSPVIKPQDDNFSQSPVSVSAKPASPPVQSNLQASAPPNTDSEPKSSSPVKTSPDVDSSAQTAPGQTRNATPGASEKPAKPVDQYEDLDPWSKSSLFRYVTMLRKEAVAESDEEKYKIFTGFVAKETRLREVLYNIEHVIKEPKPSDVTPPEPLKPTSDNKTKQKNVDHSDESGLIPVESEYFPANAAANSSAQSPDVDDIPYSPGGRPILNRPNTAQGVKTQHTALQRSASNPSGRGNSPLAKVSSAQLESDLAIRSTSVPPQSATSEKLLAPLKPDSPQPAYTPFRYEEGPQRGSESLNIVQPAYQAYSALRQASAESGRAMSGAPSETGLSVPGSAPSDETFLGIIREKSVSYRGKSPALGSGSAVEELGALIPSPFPIVEPSPEISSIEKKMEIYSDDFRYIPVATESWELSARDRRDKLDKERLTRQEKSEEHIDSMFNDKEIGYADINPLEEEFRQKEARTQLDEERKELEHFIRNVFNPLNSRLKEEIVELRALNQRAMEELKRQTVQGNHSANYQISHTMKTVNALAAKLEDRFQKRLDIALEREQRRKKAERRPYVFLGDSRALKKLDVDFEKMEKQNIVEAAKDRDERANKLADLFDGAILCALGNHQRLLDDIASKTKKLDVSNSGIKNSNLSETDTEMVMRSILALTKLLVNDAEAMLTNFKTADSLLNEADYKVSVAEAQYSSANPDIFRQLDEEKKKEDDKIQEDHASKLESVRQGPAQTNATIDQVLQVMNKEPGSGTGPWKRPAAITLPAANSSSNSNSNSPPRPSTVKPVIEEQQQHPGEALMPGHHRPRAPSAETEQQERLRKALEEAKKRNAAKNYTS